MDQDLSPSGPIESVARRPDAVAVAAIMLAVIAAWAYLAGAFGTTAGMGDMPMADMDMAAPRLGGRWGGTEIVALWTMWAVMMVGMMLPSAAPMILLFSKIGSARSTRGERHAPLLFFAGGYLTVWWGFSAFAAAVQYLLHSTAALSPDMRAVSPTAGGLVLIAAGIYQWLPVKQICLRHCRTPFGFLSTSWREGRWGAVAMGLSHGSFCLGCCWMLMILLFVAGVMNLWWVGAISALVLLEKVLPAGPAIARAAGVLLVGGGITLMV